MSLIRSPSSHSLQVREAEYKALVILVKTITLKPLKKITERENELNTRLFCDSLKSCHQGLSVILISPNKSFCCANKKAGVES